MSPESSRAGRGPGIESRRGIWLAAVALALLCAPSAWAVQPVAEAAHPGPQSFRQPVGVFATTPGDYVLTVRNGSDTGRAGRFVCLNPHKPCVYIRNRGGGPAARFVSRKGVPPFEVEFSAGKVRFLD